ncbi:MAG: hypothetical protein HY899_02180 [Deltaproteobacteria bacterium]|nr:hypothetical protein [Deltaproteobacteria bacterium]
MTAEITSLPPPDHEAVLASLLEAVFAFTGGGRLSFVNPAGETLVGRSRRVLIGRTAAEIFAHSGWIAEMLGRLDSEHAALREEGALDTPAGRLRIVAEATAVHDSVTGSVLVLYDLDSRRSLRHQDRSRQRAAELDRLVAQLAHEINNPLSGIRGAAQLLGRKLGERADLVEYTDLIVRQVGRITGLVEALMALEAPLARHERLNIHRVLNEILLLERPGAAQRGIAIEAEFDPSLPDTYGDPDRLQQLFLNILRNALAMCPTPGGRVRVTTRMEHSYYVEKESRRSYFFTVSIADNGPGLDEEALAHMFSPLFSRRKGGHGMGLAIAGAIATAHDGRIRAENLAEGGAVFHVTLPVATARAGDAATPST